LGIKPAAGLRRGDLVVSMDEQPVNEPRDLLRQVEHAAVGKPLELTVIRGQSELHLSISPAALPHAG